MAELKSQWVAQHIFSWLPDQRKNVAFDLHTLRLMTAILLAGAELRFSIVQVIDLSRGRVPYK